MRSDYEERLEARLERARELAEKNQAEAASRSASAHRIMDYIPMGQPILVGHHSERHHRADLNRIDGHLHKSVEASKKAEHYARQADAVEARIDGKGPIMSDDPDAPDKLRERIEGLEAKQELYRKINAAIRRHKAAGRAAQIAALVALNFSEATAARLLEPDFCGRPGIPTYELTNNSANLRRLKQRLGAEEVSRAGEDAEREENGIRIVESVMDNRLQLYFPGKPDEATRNKLKTHGFRWTPSLGCWQRHLSNSARHAVEMILR